MAANIMQEMAKSNAQKSVSPASKGDSGTVRPFEVPKIAENTNIS